MDEKHQGKVSCRMCDFKTSTRNRLKEHISNIHEMKTCTKCDFMSSLRERMTIHVKSVHEGIVYNHSCDQCM